VLTSKPADSDSHLQMSNIEVFDPDVIRFFYTWLKYQTSKDKDKAIPLQAWTYPEGSRRLMVSDFKTFGT